MQLTVIDYVLIAFIIIIVFMVSKKMSFADSLTPAGSCNPTAIDSKLLCSSIYPDYPKVGDIAPGGKKFCCKQKAPPVPQKV
jgi:hypothetical protein